MVFSSGNFFVSLSGWQTTGPDLSFLPGRLQPRYRVDIFFVPSVIQEDHSESPSRDPVNSQIEAGGSRRQQVAAGGCGCHVTKRDFDHKRMIPVMTTITGTQACPMTL